MPRKITTKLQRTRRTAASLAIILAAALAVPTAISVASASLDDGQFCVKATGYDGEFEGTRGMKGCGEITDAPPAPEVPAPVAPINVAALNVQCTTKPGALGGSGSAVVSWAAIPNAVAYRVHLKDSAGSSSWYSSTSKITASSVEITNALMNSTAGNNIASNPVVGISYLLDDDRESAIAEIKPLRKSGLPPQYSILCS